MSILKVEILGSEIQISYKKVEKEKLIKLITEFKKKLDEFPPNIISNDKVIIFLSALKVQDELEENKKFLLVNKINKNKIDEQIDIILNLNNEILSLKKEIIELTSKNNEETENNLIIYDKVQKLESLIESIQIRIKDELIND